MLGLKEQRIGAMAGLCVFLLALLQGAEVVVLDESFAALDPETLQRTLRCVLARARTLLVVAHP